ncbi:MAG: T9SS type A sorting domain-containing protein, partial [Proteobacteria bacterium]|nr:T9SS type A sorting domain-containing protein [Pseudomonadota bacterium]
FSLKSSGKIIIKNIVTDTTTGSFTIYTKTGIDSSSAEYVTPSPVMVIKTAAGMGKTTVNPYYIKAGVKNDFQIAITPTMDTSLFNINYVELTIPLGVTWDSTPEINVSKGTYTVSGDGSDSLPYVIKLNNADITDTSYIRLSNLTADTSLTSVSFNIKTGKDSNDIALCSSNTVHINNALFDSLITIGEAQKPGSDGYTSGMLNETVKVRGFITGPSKYFNPTTTSTSFYIQDSTGGIDVFSPGEAASLAYTLGKEIIVTGVVTEYNGLTELKYNDSTKITVISDSGAIIQPEPLPLSAGLNEPREGMLLKVEKGIVASTPYQSGTGYNMQIWNGQAIIDVRINNSTGIPDAAIFKNLKNGDYISMAGIEGQYDKTTPYTTGYQLMPRFIEDLSLYTPSDTTTAMGIKLYPNPFRPDNGEMLNIQITGPQNGKYDLKLYDLKGRLVKTFAENASSGNTVYWWNGRDEHDSYLNIGAYIVVYTLKLPDGSRKRINKAVVIGTQLN